MAWVEAVACGGRQKGVLLSFVSRAYFGARSLLPLRRSTLGSLERDRREKETGRLSVATYGDVKDREKEIQKGEVAGNGERRRRSLHCLAAETREVWMVFEECHVIIGPPFERPF